MMQEAPQMSGSVTYTGQGHGVTRIDYGRIMPYDVQDPQGRSCFQISVETLDQRTAMLIRSALEGLFDRLEGV